MNSHVHSYYQSFEQYNAEKGSFYQVIPVHENPSFSWKQAFDKVSSIPRGWFELCQLSPQDRIDFARHHWISLLPYSPHINDSLNQFFNQLDDVGVFLVQWGPGLSFECEMVYSLKDNSCFYHGMPPISQVESVYLNDQLGGHLPQDFLQFLQIHSGFSKHTDSGILRAQDIPRMYKKLVNDVYNANIHLKCRNEFVDPRELIPFYESFSSKSYQCFLINWYPVNSVGNVFFSFKDKSISDFHNTQSLSDTLAFPTFLDWLALYLESLII